MAVGDIETDANVKCRVFWMCVSFVCKDDNDGMEYKEYRWSWLYRTSHRVAGTIYNEERGKKVMIFRFL